MKNGINGMAQPKSFLIFQGVEKMKDKDMEKITRRSFLKKGKKLAYLTPVIYTFFTDSKDAMAQGRSAAALQRRVDSL